MWRSRFHRGLNLALLAVLALLPVGLVPAVSANHTSTFYLSSMRSIEQTEQFCVEDINVAYLTYDYVLNEVRSTLFLENPDWNWDMKRGGMTDFRTIWQPCRDLDQATRDEAEIEYHVEDPVITAPAYCGGTSCAAPARPLWNGPYGRVEYRWYNVWLRGNLIQAGGDTRRHVVNHETGHILGLADNDPYYSCDYSIMHPAYYYCPDNGRPAWPSAGDHDTVNRLIDGNWAPGTPP